MKAQLVEGKEVTIPLPPDGSSAGSHSSPVSPRSPRTPVSPVGGTPVSGTPSASKKQKWWGGEAPHRRPRLPSGSIEGAITPQAINGGSEGGTPGSETLDSGTPSKKERWWGVEGQNRRPRLPSGSIEDRLAATGLRERQRVEAGVVRNGAVVMAQ